MSVSDKLSAVAIKNLIPISATVELTRKCKNSCIHCYLTETRTKKINRRELSFSEIKKIFGSFKKMGTVFLNITGGEPFLRDDISEILNLAFKYRFIIKIFSSLFIDFPLDIKKWVSFRDFVSFDVSLYGRKDIHNKITQSSCFDITVENMLKLKDMGFSVTVKTPVMKININEVDWLYRFSKDNGFNFRLDPVITPTNDGDKDTVKYSISSSQLKKIINKGYFDFSNKYQQNNLDYIPCGAMRSVVAINSYGDVYPCLAYPFSVGNIKESSLEDIFRSEEANHIRNLLENLPGKCRSCKFIYSCARCPGVSYLYSGRSDYIYKTACSFSKTVIKF